jgi:hypothetical protein
VIYMRNNTKISDVFHKVCKDTKNFGIFYKKIMEIMKIL